MAAKTGKTAKDVSFAWHTASVVRATDSAYIVGRIWPGIRRALRCMEEGWGHGLRGCPECLVEGQGKWCVTENIYVSFRCLFQMNANNTPRLNFITDKEYWFNKNTKEGRWDMPPSCGWQRMEVMSGPAQVWG